MKHLPEQHRKTSDMLLPAIKFGKTNFMNIRKMIPIPKGKSVLYIISLIYSKIGDKNNPPKCDTSVVITLVGKSACAKRHKASPVLNGGGIQ
ncbi:hypothetical protein ALC57_01160 [Trachymyrmex cornetzi]|uniref:Uncharacterized protein n=1 Tax=Trachymyrmex cornetzi TaxID=471704 RepID=A0A151JQA3_9HYME|nr:hypothetical protein ALC57_01160 [Trachymyrmex cornetzi]